MIKTVGQRNVQDELLRIERFESIGFFVQSFADDFSNLLAAICANVAMAKRHLEPGNSAYHRLHQAEQASSRAKEILQQLLIFASSREPVKGLLEISQLLSETVAHFQCPKDIGYRYSIEPDSDLVKADRLHLKLVFHNLLAFARELLPDGGIIEFGTERLLAEAGNPIFTEGIYIRATMEIQEAVISEEECGRVLEPAFLTHWRDLPGKGSIIGLAASYNMVRKQGGLLEVQSRPGTGVVISIYLPAGG